MTYKQMYVRHSRRHFKQFIRYLLSVFFVGVLVSCTTVRHNSYVASEQNSAFFVDRILVGVEVDFIQENSAAKQITKMLETLLQNQVMPVKESVISTARIHINQRSVMQGIKPINSIYISCEIFSGGDTHLSSTISGIPPSPITIAPNLQEAAQSIKPKQP